MLETKMMALLKFLICFGALILLIDKLLMESTPVTISADRFTVEKHHAPAVDMRYFQQAFPN
jgi:hypothetical protein